MLPDRFDARGERAAEMSAGFPWDELRKAEQRIEALEAERDEARASAEDWRNRALDGLAYRSALVKPERLAANGGETLNVLREALTDGDDHA